MLDASELSTLERGVDVRLPPALDKALATLANTVEQFAANHSLGTEDAYRLNLVLDELVTNSFNYGFPEAAKAEVRIRLGRTRDGVTAQYEDNGIAFDPFQDASTPDTKLALDERPVGGLGVFLVTQFTDSASYRRESGVNRITLRIKLEGE